MPKYDLSISQVFELFFGGFFQFGTQCDWKKKSREQRQATAISLSVFGI